MNRYEKYMYEKRQKSMENKVDELLSNAFKASAAGDGFITIGKPSDVEFRSYTYTNWFRRPVGQSLVILGGL